MRIFHRLPAQVAPTVSAPRAITLSLCIDLVAMASDLTRNMQREFKSSIGIKLRDEYCAVMVLVARAQNQHCMAIHATQLRDGINVARMLTQVAWGHRLFSEKINDRAMALCDRVDAQAVAILASAIAHAQDILCPGELNSADRANGAAEFAKGQPHA
jgi:hypothetical protein